jgi:hypothetical protein
MAVKQVPRTAARCDANQPAGENTTHVARLRMVKLVGGDRQASMLDDAQAPPLCQTPQSFVATLAPCCPQHFKAP